MWLYTFMGDSSDENMQCYNNISAHILQTMTTVFNSFITITGRTDGKSVGVLQQVSECIHDCIYIYMISIM